MDAFTAQQTVELIARTGCKKAHMRLDKLFINSCLAGPLLGFGCAILLSVNNAPWYQSEAPGLIRMIGALLFPIGLVMITLTGADLWTTNVMFMTTAFLSRRVTILDVGKSLTVSFLGNLAGSLFFVAIIMGYGGVFEETSGYQDAVITFVMEKVQQPQWQMIFLRAIGANWLVCMAVLMSIQAREVSSKIMAIWWPTAVFVGLALDHVVANMTFVPMGIWVGAPFGVGYYIWKSMIPAALGNFVGASLFVATSYWYLYLTGEEDGVCVSFDLGGAGSAVQGGAGPLHGVRSADINGTAGTASNNPSSSPSHGRSLMSNVGSELHDDSPYAMTYMERQKMKEAELEKSSDPSSNV